MNIKRKKVVAVVLIAMLAVVPPARAVLGVGDITFDPTNFAQAVKTFLQLQQQYTQLVQLYQQARQQYDHLRRMAQTVPVNMQGRYRAVVTPWKNSSATNSYGTTSDWIRGINGSSEADSSYANSVQPLSSYGSALSSLPTEQADRVKRSVGTLELVDGANVGAMETIGRMRSNAPAIENTISALESDSLSSDPDMNTEVAVLNKINAANIVELRSSQDTNKLLASLAEEQIIQAKRVRDAEAQAINQHVRFRNEGKAVMQAQASGASEAMLAWRMP